MEKVSRIRWKLNGTEYVSIQSFLGRGGTLLKSVIDVSSLTVKVVEVNTDGSFVTLNDTRCNTVARCKMIAKILLKDCGATFFSEVRKHNE